MWVIVEASILGRVLGLGPLGCRVQGSGRRITHPGPLNLDNLHKPQTFLWDYLIPPFYPADDWPDPRPETSALDAPFRGLGV